MMSVEQSSRILVLLFTAAVIRPSNSFTTARRPSCFNVVAPTLPNGQTATCAWDCCSITSRSTRMVLHETPPAASISAKLFEDDEDMVAIAENYVRAKYRAVATSNGHKHCNNQDAVKILRSILPPVTPDELNTEVGNTLKSLMTNPNDETEIIPEDSFVKAVLNNSYWRNAGDLVVKELIYFDVLYNYYQSGTSLLNDDNYGELKDNLTWEGSSVPTMNKQEALFVTAVASARRGDPIMDDNTYTELKRDLKQQQSWVTARQEDALEKLGLDTFMGYLHRAL